MHNELKALRNIFRVIDDCPICHKSRTVKATAWRGHGTGQHGTSYYGATAFESISPKTHCVCWGGPVWNLLKEKGYIAVTIQKTQEIEAAYNQVIAVLLQDKNWDEFIKMKPGDFKDRKS